MRQYQFCKDFPQWLLKWEQASYDSMTAWADLFGNKTTIGELRICSALVIAECNSEHVTVGDLARYTGLSKTRVSRLLFNLYERGFIEYRDDPNDRRRKFVRHKPEFLKKIVEVWETQVSPDNCTKCESDAA